MDIIVAGGGKVGLTLAEKLAGEGHNLTLIDQNEAVLSMAVEQYDAIGISGNCASREVLLRAGIMEAELVIATTNEDEVNLLCCMTAHGLNEKVHTIARIRDPEYIDQIMTMRHVFPLSMTVNPEKQTAIEIERLLRYPGFLRRDTFAKGLAEIVELRVDGNSPLKDVALSKMTDVVKCRVLVCAVLRAGEAVAPSGNFVLREGDRIFVTASIKDLALMLKNLGVITRKVRSVMLCGGGRVSHYLAELLEKDKMSVKILEKSPERCAELARLLPQTQIVCGDCSDHAFLEEQGIHGCDALVSLTGMDEGNMILSLYASGEKVPQVITKISRTENGAIADAIKLGSTVCPRELCCNNIVRYVRAMENQTGAAVSVHFIADGKAEAVEFLVDENTRNCGVALKDMKLKPNVLVANIVHGSSTQIPGGDSMFQPGDTVVVVTSGKGALRQLNDIFA